MPIRANPILSFELCRFRPVNMPELTALRTKSVAWNLMPQRVRSLLNVSRLFQRFHRKSLTNFFAFFPETTPSAGLFSARRFARFDSNSSTECPTKDM
jgi:hypothetical protein